MEEEDNDDEGFEGEGEGDDEGEEEEDENEGGREAHCSILFMMKCLMPINLFDIL